MRRRMHSDPATFRRAFASYMTVVRGAARVHRASPSPYRCLHFAVPVAIAVALVIAAHEGLDGGRRVHAPEPRAAVDLRRAAPDGRVLRRAAVRPAVHHRSTASASAVPGSALTMSLQSVSPGVHRAVDRAGGIPRRMGRGAVPRGSRRCVPRRGRRVARWRPSGSRCTGGISTQNESEAGHA